MRNYKNIDAWRLADDLAVAVYEWTPGLPREELYGLTSQLRRAAASVPTNIAEGSARDGLRDYLHFLHIARGSLTEVQYLTHLAHRLGYLDGASAERYASEIKRVFGCLHGLVQSVAAEARGPAVSSPVVPSPRSPVVPP